MGDRLFAHEDVRLAVARALGFDPRVRLPVGGRGDQRHVLVGPAQVGLLRLPIQRPAPSTGTDPSSPSTGTLGGAGASPHESRRRRGRVKLLRADLDAQAAGRAIRSQTPSSSGALLALSERDYDEALSSRLTQVEARTASAMDAQRSQAPLPRAALEVFSYSLSLLKAETSWLVARVQASDE